MQQHKKELPTTPEMSDSLGRMLAHYLSAASEQTLLLLESPMQDIAESVVLEMADILAHELAAKTLLISLDKSSNEIMQKILSVKGRIPFSKLTSGDLNQCDFERLYAAVKTQCSNNLLMGDQSEFAKLSLEEIPTAVASAAANNEVKIVFGIGLSTWKPELLNDFNQQIKSALVLHVPDLKNIPELARAADRVVLLTSSNSHDTITVAICDRSSLHSETLVMKYDSDLCIFRGIDLGKQTECHYQS